MKKIAHHFKKSISTKLVYILLVHYYRLTAVSDHNTIVMQQTLASVRDENQDRLSREIAKIKDEEKRNYERELLKLKSSHEDQLKELDTQKLCEVQTVKTQLKEMEKVT